MQNLFVAVAVLVTGASAARASSVGEHGNTAILKDEGVPLADYGYNMPNVVVATNETTEAADIVVLADRSSPPASVEGRSNLGFSPFDTRICEGIVIRHTSNFAVKLESCAAPAGTAALAVIAGPKISYMPKNGLFPKIIGKNFLTSMSFYAFKGKLIRKENSIDLEGFVAELGLGGLGINIGHRGRIEPAAAVACVKSLNGSSPFLRSLGVRDDTNCKVLPSVRLSF